MHIDQKIEFWKNRLLDLSKRNRLINCIRPKDGKRVSRSTILIYKPSLEDLWNILVEREDSLQFPIPINYLYNNNGTQETELQLETFNNGILTNQSPTDTCKTLRNLMKKAREFYEEKGLNALYLAFGFLIWKENGIDGQEMRSPLILVPVSLSQKSLDEPIILSRTDDEIIVNHALEQKLLSEFGINLPRFDEADEWQNYLFQVEEICSHLNWQVEYDATQLSLFSFLKISMYRDIEINSDKIAGHHIIRTLNGECLDIGKDCSDMSNYDHDLIEPQYTFSVVDADSSQQDAILLAKRGVSFVLQGPPGTGKSQTITNIIAELIAEGKKVLFVSEKMAALEVVHKRLKQAGLSNFCLTLHSHNAKRREVLDQLGISLKLSKSKAQLQQEAFNKLFQLKDIRTELNAYVRELHTIVEPLGKSIYQVNGVLAKYASFKDVDYIQPNAENFTPELLAKCETLLEEIANIIDKSGYQQKNPWYGCILTSITHEFRQQFLVDANKLISLLTSGETIYNEIIGLTGASNLSSAFANIQCVVDLCNVATNALGIPYEWLHLDLKDQVNYTNNCSDALRKANNLNELLSTLKKHVHSMLVALNSIADNIYSLTTDKNANFESASSEIINLLPYEGDILESIKIFQIQLEECQKLDQKHREIETENSKICKDISLISQTIDNEQKILNQRFIEWQEAKKILDSTFDEKVLTIDLENILTRYRTEYRSGMKRLLSSSYRYDRKNLLGYYKSNVKMTYSKCLVYLDELLKAKIAKSNYDNQINFVNDLILNKQELERKLTQCKADLDLILEERKVSIERLEKSIQNLKKFLENTIQNYNEQLTREKLKFAASCKSLSEVLKINISEHTNFTELKQKLEHAYNFKEKICEYSISDVFIRKICNGDDKVTQKFNECVSALNSWVEMTKPWLDKFIMLFDDNQKNKFTVIPLEDLKLDIVKCRDNLAYLEDYIDYKNIVGKLSTFGIDNFIEKAKELNLASDEILPVFRKCFYRSWLDSTVRRFPSVNAFRKERHNARIQQFRTLDKLHLEISKAAIFAKLISRLPDFDSFSAYSGEIALLRREMAKQRKLMPTRKLIASIPNLLPVLKPCMMMSPLSVSTYLGNSGYEFDTVVFDEASQIRTEDAICSIFRAKQVIIAGDSKQLPPTDFFTSSLSDFDDFDDVEEEDINDAGAYESLLDEAAMLPTQMLRWHYRSKHEHLIAFSNSKIYQGKLITFPSSIEKADDLGVEYIYVAGGTYDRGGKNGNRQEAEKVAELVFEHFKNHPNRSLGIVAFGEVQQTAIEDAILRKRYENPEYEIFFSEDREEPLFIKNLETVQGDERDTIIFSIGYAPDVTGKFLMNFGPLSRIGGERRLNVAITRARCNLKLVGSILPSDIDTDRINSLGPKLLRLYIDYAINGAKAILGETTLNGEGWFDSSFEESVYDFLTNKGYDVVTQVGCSGYRIDMAVRHPKYKGRYAIGIECDGAAYHSARTARERDRLRQTILEDMGWKIYRVWSTDWVKDPHTEREKLLHAVNSAIKEYSEEIRSNPVELKNSISFLSISTKSMQESIRERFEIIKSRYAGLNVVDIPISDIEMTMLRVLQNGFGLDKTSLFKETALYGYCWQRLGSNIKFKFEQAYYNLLKTKKIEEEKDGKIKVLQNV